MQKSEPRSYIVNVGGKLYRRNRKFLRTTKEKDVEQNIPEEVPEPQPVSNGPVESNSESTTHLRRLQKTPDKSITSPRNSLVSEPTETITDNQSYEGTQSTPNVERHTRTRKIRQPKRYTDFVMK